MKSNEPILSRREFCADACRVASLAALGAVTACRRSSTGPSGVVPPLSSVAATVAGRVVTITVEPAGPLGSVGGSATAATSIGAFLIARTGPEAFTAMTATCTHEGCLITGFQNDQFVCPCHGSRYTTGGAVAQGPATRALNQFATQFSNGVLAFSA